MRPKSLDKLGILHVRCHENDLHNRTESFRGADKSLHLLECPACSVGVVSGPYTSKRTDRASDVQGFRVYPA